MQKRNDSNNIITGNVCKSLIIFIIVEEIILTNDCGLESEITCLIFVVNEASYILNIESWTALFRRFIAKGIAILTINNL